MNPNAVYSKSGKGVQEASGKTSLLKRAERAVLSAIDGRASLSEVAKKVGKPFDGAFEVLIVQLDRDGFIREVAAGGASAAPPARPAATRPAPPPKPSAPAPAAGEDLDFTGIMGSPFKSASKPAADPAAAQRAKEQEIALYKARQEAEARAQEERDRQRTEAEAKARAEMEANFRAETEKRLREEAAARIRAEAEAKAKAAREAALRLAAEAKAKAEAEARAKIEAERKAREEAERKAREEAERARREAEELRLRLEEERKAREEAERKAREEAERKAREEAERKAREEAERKAREEAERKAREEAERKAREEAERKAREEAEVQMRRAREEAERRRAQAEERERQEAEKPRVEPPPPASPPPPPAAAPAQGSGGLDALMADLDSFTQRDDQDKRARDEAESAAREDRKRKLREEGEERERDQAERQRQDAEDRRRREEEERRARDEEDRRAREEEERAREEAEERQRRAREALLAKQAEAGIDDIGVTEADLGLDDVKRDEAAVAKESRKARREREREARQREKEARERARAAARAAERPAPAAPSRPRRRRRSWGRPVGIALLIILVAGLGALHIVPLPTEDYQRVASEALRQPVRIGSARLSLFTGVQLNLADITVGGARIASARAHPQLASLTGDVKSFSRIELDGVVLPQQAIVEALSARARGPHFRVERILVKDLKLEGPVPLPVLEADVRLGEDGSVRSAILQGPEGLSAQLTPKGEAVDFDVTATTFKVPLAPELSLSSFAMKGRATRQGMKIDAWGGGALDGALSGTANLRWGATWQLDGALTARGVNAALFAPALLSEGKAEGNGRFSMSGTDPAKLSRASRIEGSFTIGKGVLSSFDLSRALRTDGREVNGRTQFVELNGQGVYDRGAVALRNVQLGAGALHAGASADISQSGALSGRIVADVRTASQSLRTTLVLGGTVKDPQARN